MNENLKRLYESLIKDGYDLPDFDTFSKDVSDKTKASKLYSTLVSDNYDLPEFDTFYKDLTPVPKEAGGFWGTIKAALGSVIEAAQTPATEPPPADPFISAIQRGIATGEQADILNPKTSVAEEGITQLAYLQQKSRSLPASESYQKFTQAKSVGEALTEFAKNPAGIVVELTAESLASMAKHGAPIVAERALQGGTVGGTIGSVVPGVGTAAGLSGGVGSGFVTGMAETSMDIEFASKFLETLQESGVDTSDPASLKLAFQNDEVMNKARTKAYQKSIPIALFDLISGGVAGKIVTKPAQSILARVGKGAAEFGIQSGLGMAGEAAGQLASGEELSAGSILAEGFGEIASAPVEIAVGAKTLNAERNIEIAKRRADEAIEAVGDTGDPQLNAAIDEAAALTPKDEAKVVTEKVDTQVKEEIKEEEKVAKEEAKKVEEGVTSDIVNKTEESVQNNEQFTETGTEQKREQDAAIDAAKSAEIKSFDQTPEYIAADEKVKQIADQVRENPSTELTTKLNEALQERDNARIAFEQSKIKRVKQEPIIVTNPAKALKEQIQTHYKLVEEGIRKGQRMTNDVLITKANDILKRASKAGIQFTNNQVNTILTKIKNTNLFTPGSVSKLGNFIENVFNDAEYSDKLTKARTINKKLRKLSKSTAKTGINIKSLARSFTSLNPEDTFINEHLRIGNQLLSSLSNPAQKGYQIANVEEIQDYITKKQQESADIQEVDIKAINEETLGTSEKRDRLMVMATTSQERLQQKDLGEFDESERKTIETLKGIDLTRLDDEQLSDAIRVMDNISENDSLANTGNLQTALEAKQAIDEIKSLMQDVNTYSQGWYARVTNNVSRFWDNFISDSTLASKIKTVLGYQELLNGGSRVENQLSQRKNEIKKVLDKFDKKTKQHFLDLNNRIKTQVFALLVRHPQDADPNAHIQIMKDSIVQVINEWRKYGDEERARVWESAYDEVKDLKTIDEIISSWSAKNPHHYEVYKYFPTMFEGLTDRHQDVVTRLYNAPYIRENNYTTIETRNINGKSKPFIARASEALFENKQGKIKPQQSTTSLKATRKLKEGSVYSDDWIVDQLSAYQETLYEIENAENLLKLHHVVNDPEFNSIFGRENADAIRDQIKTSNRIQQGLGGIPSDEFLQGMVAISQVARNLGAAKALGSTFGQIVKQIPPVMLKAISVHLSTNTLPLLLKSMRLRSPNVKKLHDMYPIGTAGLRLGGIERGNTISFNLSAGAKKKVFRAGEKMFNWTERNSTKALHILTQSDRIAKQGIWNSYYLKRLKELGVKKVNMNEEYTLQNDPVRKEAAAYAEHMMSTTQIPSNPAELSVISRHTGNQALNIIKNVILPFSTYALEAKARLVTNTKKAWRNPSAETIVGGIGGDILEVGLYGTLQLTVLALYKSLLNDLWNKMFDLEDPELDEDEEDRRARQKVNSQIVNGLNTINPYAIGTLGEFAFSKAMNRMAHAWYKIKEDPDISYNRWKRETGGFAYEDDSIDWGLLGLGFQPAGEVASHVIDLVDTSNDNPTVVEDKLGNEKEVYLTKGQRNLLLVNTMVESMSSVGVNEADIFNSLRSKWKQQSRMAKKEGIPVKR